ncbi:hypothetical protein PL9631_1630002 [Planktothrix paucivesiculata PCC 9631]|uniref:Uncharacterized protein n=1 Tax=Planktothrix paucivesiculata PCC 9631 TaxID=671071 RepID=A0A7Z9BNV1_9CYAN|nr:hypothetical protein PL9631_1630002 [Planktothrix paucivesiculata PCC 9631]
MSNIVYSRVISFTLAIALKPITNNNSLYNYIGRLLVTVEKVTQKTL